MTGSVPDVNCTLPMGVSIPVVDILVGIARPLDRVYFHTLKTFQRMFDHQIIQVPLLLIA